MIRFPGLKKDSPNCGSVLFLMPLFFRFLRSKLI